jgi:hypothetical protein
MGFGLTVVRLGVLLVSGAFKLAPGGPGKSLTCERSELCILSPEQQIDYPTPYDKELKVSHLPIQKAKVCSRATSSEPKNQGRSRTL